MSSDDLQYNTTELVRKILRAGMQADKVATFEQLALIKEVSKDAAKLDDSALLYSLTKPSSNFHIKPYQEPLDELRVNLAQAACLYLIERTCVDNAAKGRAARAWKSVETAVEELAEFRAAKRRR